MDPETSSSSAVPVTLGRVLIILQVYLLCTAVWVVRQSQVDRVATLLLPRVHEVAGIAIGK